MYVSTKRRAFVILSVIMMKSICGATLSIENESKFSSLLEGNNISMISASYKLAFTCQEKRGYGSTADTTDSMQFVAFTNKGGSEGGVKKLAEFKTKIESKRECLLIVTDAGSENFCQFVSGLKNVEISKNQVKVMVVAPSKNIDQLNSSLALLRLMKVDDPNILVFIPYRLFSPSSKLDNPLNYGVNIGYLVSERQGIRSIEISPDSLQNVLRRVSERWRVRHETIHEGLYQDENDLLSKIGFVNHFTPDRPTVLNYIASIVSGEKTVPLKLKLALISVCFYCLYKLNIVHKYVFPFFNANYTLTSAASSS